MAGFLDVESREVDLRVFIAGIALALIWQILRLSSWQDIIIVLLGGVSALLIPAVFYLVSRERWMGLGDVFFAFWIGIVASYPASLIAVFSAFLLGGIFGIIVLIARGRKAERRIAFGPFLGIGGLIGLVWGQEILNFYLKLIGF
jgi:leader peptidase (prepilin peptidase)/N-methyltransferase